MVVPVPASTEPPVVVVSWCPVGETRTEVDVDVDDWARCRFPPADGGGFVGVSRRRGCVLDGGTVQEPRGMVGIGGGLWPEVGFGFSAGLHTGWVPLSTMGGTLNTSIAFVAER